MKILFVNKFHYLRAGAERAYFDMGKILEENGHDVAYFSAINKKNEKSKWSKYFTEGYELSETYGILKNIKVVFNIFYNLQAKRRIVKLIKDFKPDIVHMHNIYHHLSPSIIDGIKKCGVPMVMTLHDYRLVCPNYNLYVRNKIWEKTGNGKYYKCVLDKCVKDSYSKSLVMAVESYIHKWRKTYEKVDMYISPSHFLINKFKELGFKNEIKYLPNPLCFSVKPKKIFKEKYILYYGRLSCEKGIDDLINAYAGIAIDYSLYIVGSGPSEDELKEMVKERDIKNIKFLGYKTGDDLWNTIGGAEFVVVPSRWYENAPYSVVEAMKMGKVVLCSKIGGLTELIKDGVNGFSFEFADISSLKNKMQYIIKHPELKEKIEKEAKKTVQKKNNKNIFYKNLMDIYKELTKNKYKIS